MPGLVEKPVRIAYYVPCLEVGGVEKNVHDLALGLPRDLFTPIVFWSCYYGPLGDALQDAGVPVQHIPLNEPRRVGEAAAMLKDWQPRIFHSFSYREDASDVQTARTAGIATILTNRPDLRFWDKAKTVRDWERERNAATHRITACSDAIARVVQCVEGVDEAKIRVIHNGVKMPEEQDATPTIREQLGIGAESPLIGYVANYRLEKGHGTLLRAFKAVWAKYPQAHLLCCGGGDSVLKAELGTLAAELGLIGHVHLLGLQMNVHRIYRGLSLYVHASDTEGFSNSLLEAMSHALPVVATSVGGNLEAVEQGKGGCLVPSGNAEQMADAITSLLGDPRAAAAMGHAAKERVAERFTFKRMLKGYIDLYRSEIVPA